MKYLCIVMFLMVTPFTAVQAASLYSSVRDGVELFEQEKYEKALEIFLAAQVDNPESTVLKFDIASCHYRLQKYNEAATGYLDVVATAQEAGLEASALYNLGNTMYRQGKLEEAVEYYKKTLELDSEDEDARKNLEFVREEIRRRLNEAKNTQQRQQEKQQDRQGDQQNKQGDPQARQEKQQGQPESQKNDSPDNQQKAKDGSQETQQDTSQESQPDSQQQKQQKGSFDDGADERMQPQPDTSGKEGGSPRSTEEDLRDIAGGDLPMSAEEAEQWLRGLEENRDKLQQFRRQSQPGQPRRPEKNW